MQKISILQWTVNTVSNMLEQGFMMQVHNYTSGYDLCASIHLYRQQHQQNTAQHALSKEPARLQQNVVAGSCSCPESDGMGYLKHASHFPDRNTTLQPCNRPRSVEVGELNSWTYVEVVQYAACAATYKGALIHTGYSQRCNCALTS